MNQKLPEVRCGLFSSGFSYVRNPYKFFDKGLHLYGKNFVIPYFGGKKAYLFSDPQYVEEIFKADPNKVLSGEGNKLLRPILGQKSLLTLDGDDHVKEKKILTPPFIGERMKVYSKTIEQIVLEIIEKKRSEQEEIILNDICEDSTVEVILRTVFGADKGEALDKLRELFKELKAMANSVTALAIFFPVFQKNLGPLTPYAKFLKLQNEVNSMLYDLIESKKKSSPQEDILSVIVGERYDDGGEVDQENIKDQLVTLLTAGQDTTNHSLAWIFTWLFNNTEKMDSLIKALDDYSDVEQAAKDIYLDCVIKESLRIFPVFSCVNRLPKDDFTVGGKYLVPKGAYLTAFVYGAHHNEEVFDNSFEFRPERFLDQKFSPYEYFPFGGGRRRCIGQAFSMNQMKITLVTIFKNYKLTAITVHKPKPIREGIGMRPKGNIKVKFEARA